MCQVSARVPYSTANRPGYNDIRVFTQNYGLVEERRSGTSAVRQWTVIGDSPDQIVASDPSRAATLIIDWPGATFAESGLARQQRGYCRMNELP